MKILVLTSSEWDDRNASGNTYSNWFGGSTWSKDEFSNFYMRYSLPDNEICEDYYRVTPQGMLKKLFHPSDLGSHIRITRAQQVAAKASAKPNSEKKQIAWLHRNPSQVIYAGMEWLCRHQGWDNQKLADYLEQFDPDIVFASLSNNGMWKPLMQCIRRHTHAKIVVYASDDVYGSAQKKAWYRRIHLVPEYEWCVRQADKLYGASEELCLAYEKLFGREFSPIYKGCEFAPVMEKAGTPLRFVYAGNLYYGRAQTLAALAQVLSKVNQNGRKAILEIYTGTEPTEELRAALNLPGTSKIMGQRPYEQIKQIMHQSDVVLHVESFEQKQIDYVHYSFSTKIPDCLQSGTVPFAIGPAGIASIEYMRKIPGAWVVDHMEQLETAVLELVAQGDKLPERARQAREFAAEHHDLEKIRRKLRNDFEELLNRDESCSN